MIASSGVTVHRVSGGRWDQNCYVLSVDAGDAVVVDPGGGADRVVEHLEAGGLRLRAVLATHGHHDHVSAAAELLERHAVPFGIHSGDSAILRRVNLARFAIDGQGPVPVPAVGIDLADAERLRFGALEATVVHTPGHTPGGVCFEVAGELFTGDTLLASEPARTDLPGGDGCALRASIAALSERYPPRTVVWPGHGPMATLGEAVDRLRPREESGR